MCFGGSNWLPLVVSRRDIQFHYKSSPNGWPAQASTFQPLNRIKNCRGICLGSSWPHFTRYSHQDRYGRGILSFAVPPTPLRHLLRRILLRIICEFSGPYGPIWVHMGSARVLEEREKFREQNIFFCQHVLSNIEGLKGRVRVSVNCKHLLR